MKNRIDFADHIQKWKKTELSQIEYCRRHGIPYKSFIYHLRKSRSRIQPESKTPAFVNLSTSEQAPFEIRLKDGETFIKVPQHFDAAALRRLVESLPC